MNPFDHLELHYGLMFSSLPRPIAPQPSGPVTEPCDLPTDRSDFTRDSEATGA